MPKKNETKKKKKKKRDEKNFEIKEQKVCDE